MNESTFQFVLVVQYYEAFSLHSLAKSLIDKPRMLGSALFEAIGQFVNKDIELGISQNRFNPPITGALLDNMMKWSLVGLLIEAGDSELDTQQALLGYAQAFLMILGLASDEAKEISIQAAQKFSQ